MSKDWCKVVCDALLPFGYSKIESNESSLKVRAGNGSIVVFKSIKRDSNLCIEMVTDESCLWAIRQVANIFSAHPCFNMSPSDTSDGVVAPWIITIREDIMKNKRLIEGILWKNIR